MCGWESQVRLVRAFRDTMALTSAAQQGECPQAGEHPLYEQLSKLIPQENAHCSIEKEVAEHWQ